MWPTQRFAKQINIIINQIVFTAEFQYTRSTEHAPSGVGGRHTARHPVGHTPRLFSVLAITHILYSG